MRIAVSGTHCAGKTTLIDEFLRAHPDFAHEPEPYTVLVEDFGEEFSSEPCVDDFYRQLEFNVDRLRHHSYDERVIYERSPVDFIAYILALKDFNTDDVDPALLGRRLG
jgi:predicted ATPase